MAIPTDEWLNRRLGSRLGGRYELVSLLGKGGQGAVYGARDAIDGDRCAVKVLHQKAAMDATARERMLREARALLILHDTCAVGILDQVYTEDGCLALVTEWLDGRSLADHLKQLAEGGQWMPLSALRPIFEPIVKALDAAHSIDIVHRDLKPGNIFLTGDAHALKPRLLDFGFVRFVRLRRLTADGFVAGSPSYLSPEAWRGEPVDTRGDLYSLAAVLYRCLAGQPPFAHERLMELMKLVTRAPRPSLHALRPDLPRDVDRWVEQALAPQPDQRFYSARAVFESLAGVLSLPPGSSLPPRRAAPMP